MRTIIGLHRGLWSVLIFHQARLLHRHRARGSAARIVHNMRPVPPFGVPLILSAAFWGGLWGIVGAYIVPRLPVWMDGPTGWILFAGIVVTLVNWFIVLPIIGVARSATDSTYPASSWCRSSTCATGAWDVANHRPAAARRSAGAKERGVVSMILDRPRCTSGQPIRLSVHGQAAPSLTARRWARMSCWPRWTRPASIA